MVDLKTSKSVISGNDKQYPRPQTSLLALVPLSLLVLIGAMWGGFFPLWSQFRRCSSGQLSILVYIFKWYLAFCRGDTGGLQPKYKRSHWGYYLRLGLVRFTLANMILYTVQGKLPVGIMAVIMSFVPIFTYSISLIAKVEKYLWLRAAGIFVGVSGALLIVIPKSSLPNPAMAFWVLIGFGAPLLHAIAYVALSEKSRPADADSLTLSSGTLLAAALFALPLAIGLGELPSTEFPS